MAKPNDAYTPFAIRVAFIGGLIVGFALGLAVGAVVFFP